MGGGLVWEGVVLTLAPPVRKFTVALTQQLQSWVSFLFENHWAPQDLSLPRPKDDAVGVQ